MLRRPRVLLVIFLASLTLAASAWGVFAWQQRRIVLAGLPTMPSPLSPSALQTRCRELTEKVRSAPGSSIAELVELAYTYHANGFDEQAERLYVALSVLQPSETRWLALRAGLAGAAGRQTEAQELWQTAHTRKPSEALYSLHLADTWRLLGENAKAEAAYAQVLRNNPGNPYAHFGMGFLRAQNQRWSDAKDYLLRALDRQPDFASAANLLITANERLQDDAGLVEARARAKLSNRFRATPTPWLDELWRHGYISYRLAVTASALSLSGDDDQARLVLRRAVSLDPNSFTVHRQLGELALRQNRTDEAATHLRECVRLSPELSDGWVGLGNLLLSQQRRAEAAALVEDGLRACPTAFGLHILRARLAVATGKVDAALASFRRAGELQPDNDVAFIEAARLCFKADRIEEGITFLKGALRADPDNPFALFLTTRHAIAQKDLAAADRGLARLRHQPKIESNDLQLVRQEYRAQFRSEPKN